MPTTRRRILGSVLFALLWIGVAAARPTTTFHLAPLIVAAWPAVGELDPARATLLSGVGLAIVVTTTALLAAAGWLDGPSLLPWGGPVLESLAAAAAGVIIVFFPLLRRRDAPEVR